MRIDILYRAPWQQWQSRLAGELARAGHDVRPVLDPAPSTVSRTTHLALRIQQLAFGPQNALFNPAPCPSGVGGGSPDLVLALDGAVAQAANMLEPAFAGVAGEGALIATVSTGRAVPIAIRSRHGVVTKALCANEHLDVVSRGLDQVLKRIVTLLLQAVARATRPTTMIEEAETAAATSVRSFAVLRGFARKMVARVKRVRPIANHWRVAYRLEPAIGLAQNLAWPTPFFQVVPGTLDRFYADPMPVEIDGRRWILFEDYPYATKKGVIAIMEIMPNGSAGPARTVLERDVHLSYPFIIRHEGTIYMLPEMSGAKRVQLFRADPFPDRWVPDRVLIEGVVASDATLVRHGGRWWMFVTLADDGGSTWDSLCVFHAPDLFGPWTAHVDNPVLVDAGAARPAGPMWLEDGALMRIVQDCRDGYGRGLALCRIDRLDESGYAQTVLARLGAPDLPGADGVHTLAKDGALEVIDLRFTGPESLRPAPERG